jgi:hypothetical protein
MDLIYSVIQLILFSEQMWNVCAKTEAARDLYIPRPQVMLFCIQLQRDWTFPAMFVT